MSATIEKELKAQQVIDLLGEKLNRQVVGSLVACVGGARRRS